MPISHEPFRLLLLVLIVATVALRIRYHAHAGTLRDRDATRAGFAREGAFRWLRPLLGLPALASLAAYLIHPPSVGFAALPLPESVRWAGFGVGVIGLGLLAWVHRSLGRNFHGTLVIRGDHTLVREGPYRWVRHPMYTAFLLMVTSYFLLSANGLIGGFGIAAIVAVIVLRTPLEEAQLLERFGEEYREYISQTGRLLPRLMR